MKSGDGTTQRQLIEHLGFVRALIVYFSKSRGFSDPCCLSETDVDGPARYDGSDPKADDDIRHDHQAAAASTFAAQMKSFSVNRPSSCDVKVTWQ